MKKLNKKLLPAIVVMAMIINYILPIVPVKAADLTKDYSEMNNKKLDEKYSYGTVFWTDDTKIELLSDNTASSHYLYTNPENNRTMDRYGAKLGQKISLRITKCAVDKDGDLCDVICKVDGIEKHKQGYGTGEDADSLRYGLFKDDLPVTSENDYLVQSLSIGKYGTSNLVQFAFHTNKAKGHFTMQYVKTGTTNKANISNSVASIADLDARVYDDASNASNFNSEDLWHGSEGITMDGATGDIYYAKNNWLLSVDNEKGVRTPNTKYNINQGDTPGKDMNGDDIPSGINVVTKDGDLDKYNSAVITETLNNATFKLFYSGYECAIKYIFASPFSFKLDGPEKKVSKTLVAEGEKFNYTIMQHIPNNYYSNELTFTGDNGRYESFTISDTLNSNLTIDGNVTVKNESGKDCTSLFDITTTNNVVEAKVKTAQLSNVDLYAHTYSVIIPVYVKQGTKDAVTGIANTATTTAKSTITETLTSDPVKTNIKYKEDVTATIDNGTTKITDKTNSTSATEEKKVTTYSKYVKAGESSTIEVNFKPETSYKIKKITVDNVEIPLSDTTKNSDGSYTYTFTDANINENIKHDMVITTEVVYGEVIVKYVDEEGKEIATSQTLNDKIGESYQTQPKDIKNYEIKTTPTNANGTYTETPITVTYVYKLKDASVLVKYLEAGTEKELAESVTISGKATDPYTTQAKTIEKYTLTTTPTNANGTMTDDPIVVTYYYTKTPGTVIATYVDEDGEEIADPETYTGTVDQEYETEEKQFDEYELIKVPENAKGTFTTDTINVTYVYKLKDAKLVIKYQDEDGNKIADDDIQTKKYCDEYDTSGKNINGYNLVGTPDNASGTIEKDTTTVIYVYKLKDAKVIAEYVDEDGNKLASPTTIVGKYFEKYNTESKKISGYTLTKKPENASGTMNQDTTTVRYVYSKNSSSRNNITNLPKTGEKNMAILGAIIAIGTFGIIMKIKSKKLKF